MRWRTALKRIVASGCVVGASLVCVSTYDAASYFSRVRKAASGPAEVRVLSPSFEHWSSNIREQPQEGQKREASVGSSESCDNKKQGYPSASSGVATTTECHQRCNVDIYEVDVPDTFVAMVKTFNHSRGDNEKHFALAALPAVALLNSFTLRIELIVAALLCNGVSSAWQCWWVTSRSGCRSLLEDLVHRCSSSSAAATSSGTAVNDPEVSAIPDVAASVGAWRMNCVVVPAPTTATGGGGGGSSHVASFNMSFAPLDEASTKRQETGGKAGFKESLQFEGMEARLCFSSSSSSPNADNNHKSTSREEASMRLQLMHVTYPFNYFEEGSVVERRVLWLHDLFCFVILAQTLSSLERLLRKDS